MTDFIHPMYRKCNLSMNLSSSQLIIFRTFLTLLRRRKALNHVTISRTPTHKEKSRERHTCRRLSLWMVDLYVHRVVQSGMDGVDRVVHVKSVDTVDAFRVPVRPEYVVLEQRYAERMRQIYHRDYTHAI